MPARTLSALVRLFSVTLLLCFLRASSFGQTGTYTWQKVEPEGEYFSVMMPGPVTPTNIPTSENQPLKVRRYESKVDTTGLAFIITSLEFPEDRTPGEADIGDYADAYLSSICSGMKGACSATSAHREKLNGNAGIHVNFRFQSYEGWVIPGAVRFYIVGQKTYSVMAFGKEADDPAVDRFLKSFTLADGNELTIAKITKKIQDKNTPPDVVKESYLERAKIYLRLKKFDQAASDYTELIKLDAKDVRALAARAAVYDDQGKTELAIADYSKLLEASPDSPGVYELRAELYEKQKKLDLAAADYTKYLQTSDLAKSILQKLTADPSNDKNRLVMTGVSQVLSKRAKAYSGLKKFDLAAADYGQIIKLFSVLKETDELRPYVGDYYHQRGHAYHNGEKFDLAAADFTSAIAFKPDASHLYRDRAAANAAGGKFDLAAADYTKLIELKPEEVDNYGLRANVYLRQGQFDLAIADVKKVISLDPKKVDAYFWQAQIYQAQNKITAAEMSYRDALRVAPDNPTVLNNLGYFLADNERSLDEAIELLRKAVSSKPDAAYILGSLGWAYFKAGRLAEAKQYLVEAVGIDASSALRLEHLGDVLDKRGEKAAALTRYQQALTISKGGEQKTRLTSKMGAGQPPNSRGAAGAIPGGMPAVDGESSAKGGDLGRVAAPERRTLTGGRKGKAVAAAPETSSAVIAMIEQADALFDAGNYKQALSLYRRIATEHPGSAEAHSGLGAAYNAMGEYGNAFQPFVKALRLAPGDPEAHYGIGHAYVNVEKPKEALPYLKAAIRLNPEHAEARYDLGLAYLMLNNKKAAAAEQETLTRFDKQLAAELGKAINRN